MPEQYMFPFYLDQDRLKVFLTQWCAIEDEEDRLREDKRLLKETHADDFPMRAILTAVKVVRARQKLAMHAKEPLKREHQDYCEQLVARHLDEVAAQGETLARDAATVPDMTR